MSRRIGIGRFWHESNSFSCIDTEISDFESFQRGLLTGADVLKEPLQRDELAGMIEVLRAADVEIVPLLSVGALPSGLISGEAMNTLEGVLRDHLEQAGPLDGVCLALHGAMSAQGVDDADGHFMAIVREYIGDALPLTVALDCHAVVTRQMVDLATALVAYRTHPHIDLVETGALAARILIGALDGMQPVMAWQKIPIVFPPPNEGTHAGALKELFDTLIAWDELDDVIACSLCPAFPFQDVPEIGVTAIAVTRDNPELARRLAAELAQRTWDRRADLQPEAMGRPDELIQRAAAVPGCPVVITDSADTVGGGAPGDNSVLLQALVEHRHQVDGLILAHLPDAAAVATLRETHVGETVTIDVGGKRDSRFSSPLTVTGEILSLAEGPIPNEMGFTTDPTVATGTLVCLGIDNIRLVLSERVIMGPHPAMYRHVGIEPYEAKLVTLKTGVGFKPSYGHVARAVFLADCPGAVSYNLCNFDFSKAVRPLYPLVPDLRWEPA